MHNINDNAVQGRLSENYLTWKSIAWNILDTKYSRFTVNHTYMQFASYLTEYKVSIVHDTLLYNAMWIP